MGERERGVPEVVPKSGGSGGGGGGGGGGDEQLRMYVRYAAPPSAAEVDIGDQRSGGAAAVNDSARGNGDKAGRVTRSSVTTTAASARAATPNGSRSDRGDDDDDDDDDDSGRRRSASRGGSREMASAPRSRNHTANAGNERASIYAMRAKRPKTRRNDDPGSGRGMPPSGKSGNPAPARIRPAAASASASASASSDTAVAADIVLCACGNMTDFGPMIQCFRCKGWSHKFCTGLSDAEWDRMQLQHARYFCWLCAPRNAKPGSVSGDAVQALASVRTGTRWNSIMARIVESAAMENAQVVGEPPFRPKKYRAVEARTGIDSGGSSSGHLMGPFRGIRSTGPRVATTDGATPLQRDPAREAAFYEALAHFWEQQTGVPWQMPVFRGKPLDLYALYCGVKRLGGIETVIARKRWPEIWRSMRNYYRESTDHSFRIRTASQQFLQAFLEAYPERMPWDVDADGDEVVERGPISYGRRGGGGGGGGGAGSRTAPTPRPVHPTTQQLIAAADDARTGSGGEDRREAPEMCAPSPVETERRDRHGGRVGGEAVNVPTENASAKVAVGDSSTHPAGEEMEEQEDDPLFA